MGPTPQRHHTRQHKKEEEEDDVVAESHPSVVSAPCSAELRQGQIVTPFYFFSLLLRYIHSTHSIWNADESPSYKGCIHKYRAPPLPSSLVSSSR